MIRHFLSIQFLGFLAVGGLAAFLNWIARIVLSTWLPFPVAVGLAYLVGMASAFLLNKRFVFPRSTRPMGKQIRDFTVTNLLFFPVVWFVAIWANVLLIRSGWSLYREALAHAFALSIPMFATFLIYKFLAFKVEKA